MNVSFFNQTPNFANEAAVAAAEGEFNKVHHYVNPGDVCTLDGIGEATFIGRYVDEYSDHVNNAGHRFSEAYLAWQTSEGVVYTYLTRGEQLTDECVQAGQAKADAAGEPLYHHLDDRFEMADLAEGNWEAFFSHELVSFDEEALSHCLWRVELIDDELLAYATEEGLSSDLQAIRAEGTLDLSSDKETRAFIDVRFLKLSDPGRQLLERLENLTQQRLDWKTS